MKFLAGLAAGALAVFLYESWSIEQHRHQQSSAPAHARSYLAAKRRIRPLCPWC